MVGYTIVRLAVGNLNRSLPESLFPCETSWSSTTEIVVLLHKAGVIFELKFNCRLYESKRKEISCGLKSYEQLNFVDWHKSDVTNLVLRALRATCNFKTNIANLDLEKFFVLRLFSSGSVYLWAYHVVLYILTSKGVLNTAFTGWDIAFLLFSLLSLILH